MGRAAHWIAEGVELIQIRERDLAARQLAELTRNVLRIPNPRGTRILVNDRADIAIACGAHGVHLRDGSISPTKFAKPEFLVTVSCHRIDDADAAMGASFILLAPIFKPLSKSQDTPVLGTGILEEFTRRSSIPVLALGGINRENIPACLNAGAAGIAGITWFDLS
jgi:thiamine-phosphate pyrophosphorylase